MTLTESEHDFIGREDIKKTFCDTIFTAATDAQIFSIHGMAGLGKSQLIQYLVRVCQEKHILYCLIDGFIAKDPIVVLEIIRNQLSSWAAFVEFDSVVKEYKLLAQIAPQRYSDSKNEQMEHLVSLLLTGIKSLTERQLVILFFDTYEIFEIEDDWFRGFISKGVSACSDNFKVIVAGRNSLSWEVEDRGFWRHKIFSLKLPMFTYDEVVEYVSKRLGDTYVQIARQIFEFTEGHPLCVCIAVDDIEDSIRENTISFDDNYFPAHTAEIHEEIKAQFFYTRIIQRISDPLLKQAILFGIIMRRLSAEVLVAILEPELTYAQAERVIHELKRYSFVERYEQNGSYYFKIHDLIRRIRLRELRDDVLQYKEYHRRALRYYEKAAENTPPLSKDTFLAEKMYHQLVVNENLGIQLFQTLFERHRLSSTYAFCSQLIDMVAEHQLTGENSLWFYYYCACNANDYNRWEEAEQYCSKVIENTQNRLLEALSRQELAYSLLRLDKWSLASEHYLKSCSIFNALGEMAHEGLVYRDMGDLNRHKGDWDVSLENYQQALVLAKAVNAQYLEAQASNSLGILYKNIGLWQDSIICYKRSKLIFEGINDKYSLSKVLNNLGIVCWYNGNWDDALVYLQSSLKIKRETGNYYGQGHALNGLGKLYLSLGRSSEAIATFIQSLNSFDKVESRYGRGIAMTGLGETYVFLGDPNQAEKYFQQSLDISLELGSKYGQGLNLIGLGDVFQLRSNFETSLDYYMQSLKIMRLLGNKYEIASALLKMCVVYQQQNKRSYLSYYKKLCKKIANEMDFYNILTSIELLEGKSKLESKQYKLGFPYIAKACKYAAKYNIITLEKSIKEAAKLLTIIGQTDPTSAIMGRKIIIDAWISDKSMQTIYPNFSRKLDSQ